MSKFLIHIHSGPDLKNKATLGMLVALTAFKKGNEVKLFLGADGTHLLKLKYNNSIIKTNISGSYNLINIICAIKVASYFNVKSESIKKLIPKIGIKNRSEFIKTKKNEIILDAYNANPNSMKIAINNFIDIENYDIKDKVIIITL